jgi:hypothetical protein
MCTYQPLYCTRYCSCFVSCALLCTFLHQITCVFWTLKTVHLCICCIARSELRQVVYTFDCTPVTLRLFSVSVPHYTWNWLSRLANLWPKTEKCTQGAQSAPGASPSSLMSCEKSWQWMIIRQRISDKSGILSVTDRQSRCSRGACHLVSRPDSPEHRLRSGSLNSNLVLFCLDGVYNCSVLPNDTFETTFLHWTFTALSFKLTFAVLETGRQNAWQPKSKTKTVSVHAKNMQQTYAEYADNLKNYAEKCAINIMTRSPYSCKVDCKHKHELLLVYSKLCSAVTAVLKTICKNMHITMCILNIYGIFRMC